MRDDLPPPTDQAQAFAKQLRRPPTPQEQVLWEHLRNRRAAGLKVRRQHPIGPFILDFYCPEARLAVEVDGPVHDDPAQRRHDANRTEWLASVGIRVLRVTNMEIVLNVDAVVAAIIAAAGEHPHPNPLPLGEGASDPGEDPDPT